MALAELKKIREIRREIVGLELRELEVYVQTQKLPDDDPRKVEELAHIAEERQRQLDLLDKYESRYLLRKAENWGIELPFKEEWYAGKGLLNNLGRAVITKQIRDARFAYWKGWVELLIPVLSLLLAIIALLKK